MVVTLGVVVRSTTESTAFDVFSPWVLLTLALTVLLAERRNPSAPDNQARFVGLAALNALAYALLADRLRTALATMPSRRSLPRAPASTRPNRDRVIRCTR